MTRQHINIGTNANDGTGDPLRTAFDKINDNFIELYGGDDDASSVLIHDTNPRLAANLDVKTYQITTSTTDGNISIQPNGTGSVYAGSLKINGTTLSSDDSSVITLAENVTVTGTLTGTAFTGPLTGNVTGNLTGNVTGNLTGNAAGNHTGTFNGTIGNVTPGAITGTTVTANTNFVGNITGDVTGNVTGDVTGDLIGDIYANNGTSKIFENGTNGTDATFTGNLIGNISAISDTDISIVDNSPTSLEIKEGTNTYLTFNTADSGGEKITLGKKLEGGAVEIAGDNFDINGGSIDNADIGVAVRAAGNFTTVDANSSITTGYISLSNQTITTSSGNNNLQLSAHGTGVVDVQSPLTTLAVTVNGDLTVDPAFTSVLGGLTFNGTSITAGTGITVTAGGGGSITLDGDRTITNWVLADNVTTSSNLYTNTITGRTSNADLTITTQGSGNIDVDTNKIINLTDPTSAQDAATKAYVDLVAGGGSTIVYSADDSTTTSVSEGVLQIKGSGSVSTTITGDILTITGPDLTNYLNSTQISVSGNKILSTQSNADIELDPEGTGKIQMNGPVKFNAGYIEEINSLTSSTTITIDCSISSVHKVTLDTNTEFVISNLPTGGTVTLIIRQDGVGSRTATFGTDGSTAVKFPSGNSTLSTSINAIDIVSIFNDGLAYLGNISKNYS